MNHTDNSTRFGSTDAVRANLRERSVRGMLYTAAGSGMDLLLRIGSTAVLARFLLPENFGLVAMVTAVTAIAEQFRDLGLSAATVQHREITHAQISNLFWINAAAGCCVFATICAVSPLIAAFYHEPKLLTITIALSTNFLWSGLAVQHQALLNRQMKLREMASLRLAASFVSTCLAVMLAVYHYGYWALVWREIARSVLILAGSWLFCHWIPGRPSRNAEIRELLRFGTHMTLTQLVIAAISSIDRLLIGKYFGPAAVGIYRQAQQLVMLPIQQINGPIASVSQPALSSLQADPGRYRRFYQRVLFVVGYVTMPIALFVAVYADEITLVVLGEKWRDAAIFIRIFALAGFTRPVVSTSGIVLATCGQPRRLLIVSSVHSACLALLMFCGLPWGAKGVAFAHVSSSILLLLPKLYYSFLSTPITIRAFFRAIRTPLMASAAMTLALFLFRDFDSSTGAVLRLVYGCGVAAATYAMVSFLLPGGCQELKSFRADFVTALRPKRTMLGTTSANRA